MDVADFLRVYHVRAPQVMWLLGAGASAAANIATAGYMIWDFKRRLYCAAQRVPLAACQDLGDPTLQAKLQDHFDASGAFPAPGADDEYAAFFEAVYPRDADRRRYIEDRVAAGTPSHGHLVLAALCKLNLARVIWTTNFDRVVEDAVAAVLGTSGRLITATLDTPDLARQALTEGRGPLLVKLHGDFHSRRLKNTTGELQAQDRKLRDALVDACRRGGLAVVGYSGRDHSVMDALEEALDGGEGFPQGLFWFHRGQWTPLPRVEALVARAQAFGIDAHIIPLETFDELLGDLWLHAENIPADLAARFDRRSARVSDAPLPPPGGGYPVIRLNALPLPRLPRVCRLVRCGVGGTREAREAVERAGVPVLIARRRAGVLAFGRDADVRAAFEPHGITQFDLYQIEPRRLAFESAEHGLLLDAIVQAFGRERPVETVRRRGGSHMLVAAPDGSKPALLESLKKAAGVVRGVIKGSDLAWGEAIRVRLDFRAGRPWLLLEPTIWIQHTDDEDVFAAGRAFRQDRLAGRFNRAANDVLDAWAELLAGGEADAEVRAFGVDDGVDAVFAVGRRTAFSRRQNPTAPRSAARVGVAAAGRKG